MMSQTSKKELLAVLRARYQQADRKEKGRILDELVAVTGYHRKSLIRLLAGKLERRQRRRQRGPSYGPEVDDALRVIVESLDHICAERLTPNLGWLARHLAEHGELEATPALLVQKETGNQQARKQPWNQGKLDGT